MPIHTIFTCIDIMREIASYLSFENKFLVNKIFNTNCFISCNFTGKKFRYQCIGYITKVTDFSIINTNDVKQDGEYDYDLDSEFCEYLGSLSSNFISDFDEYYDRYYDYDICDYMNDEYNNVSYEKIRELSELCLTTYMSIYSRKLVECVENKKISRKYLQYNIFQLDDMLKLYIHTQVDDYYKYVFDNDIDINLFCQRCCSFGHYDTSKECILYNSYYENKRVTEEVSKLKKCLLDKVVERDNLLQHIKTLCVSCKTNTKNNRCSNNNCRRCCNCIGHNKNKRK